MPSLEWNRQTWNGRYDWSGRGEEWSAPWGGSEPQWFGALFPRLHRILPAGAVLEIAPGFGRWTKFLLPLCDTYLGIDLSAQCVDACREVFAAASHATFAQNDGRVLDAAPAASFDLVFSFDSLVHAEIDILEAYIPQILQKLTPAGVAFIHHSNFRDAGKNLLNPHSRATSGSAARVAQMVEQHAGKVLVQELVNWGDPVLHDCITTFGNAAAYRDVTPAYLANPEFIAEASIIRRFHSHYCHIDAAG